MSGSLTDMVDRKSERLEIRLEPELLRAIDLVRGSVARSEFIRQLVRESLEGGGDDRFDALERRIARLEQVAGLE